MVEKPLIFLSHAHLDSNLAKGLKDLIEKTFAGGVEVFVSSAGSIALGEEWLEDIVAKLEKTKVLLVLLTPNSTYRPWIWFETGIFWRKLENKNNKFIPITTSSKIELPEIFGRREAAKEIYLKAGIVSLLKRLIEIFAFGEIRVDDVDHFLGAANINILPEQNLAIFDPNQSSLYESEDSKEEMIERIRDLLTDDFRSVVSRIFEIDEYSGAIEQILDSLVNAKILNNKLHYYVYLDHLLRFEQGTCKRILEEAIKDFTIKLKFAVYTDYSSLYPLEVRPVLKPINNSFRLTVEEVPTEYDEDDVYTSIDDIPF